MCITSFLMLYTCMAFVYSIVFDVIHGPSTFLFKSHFILTSVWKLPYLFCIRFFICMLHELFTWWLCTLQKISLAHHNENCDYDCGFCTSCGHLESLSIGAFMRLLLCLPSLCFHGSTIPLFDWNCIDNKYACFSLLLFIFLFGGQGCSCFPFCFWTVVICVTPTSLRVYLNVQSLVCCMMRGGWVLVVWASWFHQTFCFQCCYWLHRTRSDNLSCHFCNF